MTIPKPKAQNREEWNARRAEEVRQESDKVAKAIKHATEAGCKIDLIHYALRSRTAAGFKTQDAADLFRKAIIELQTGLKALEGEK
jgi:hypothetical protein